MKSIEKAYVSNVSVLSKLKRLNYISNTFEKSRNSILAECDDFRNRKGTGIILAYLVNDKQLEEEGGDKPQELFF